jgi:hypothetical protein
MSYEDYKLVSVADIIKTATGLCVVDAFWLTTQADEVLFHTKFGGYTPLCSADREIVNGYITENEDLKDCKILKIPLCFFKPKQPY